MVHWSVDEAKFKKNNPQEYRLWRLIHQINYGLRGEKLNRLEVKKYWVKIKEKIDPGVRGYFNYLLWGKRPSLKNTSETF